MDAGLLKIKIDIITEHTELKKKYSYKQKEIKRQEVKHIFDGFKDFFKTEGHFKFKENEHSVTAEYKDYTIKLEMDVYNNIDSDDFAMHGRIETFEEKIYEFTAEGVYETEKALPPVTLSEEELMVYESKYYTAFFEEDPDATFKYRLNGDEKEYMSIIELLQAI